MKSFKDLQELSKETVGSYYKKSATQAGPLGVKQGKADKQTTARIRSGKTLKGYKPKDALTPDEAHTFKKRSVGMVRAKKRMGFYEDENLSEAGYSAAVKKAEAARQRALKKAAVMVKKGFDHEAAARNHDVSVADLKKHLGEDTVNEVAQPKPADEKRFVDLHTIEFWPHPVALDSQFDGTIQKDTSRDADYQPGEDEAVYDTSYANRSVVVGESIVHDPHGEARGDVTIHKDGRVSNYRHGDHTTHPYVVTDDEGTRYRHVSKSAAKKHLASINEATGVSQPRGEFDDHGGRHPTISKEAAVKRLRAAGHTIGSAKNTPDHELLKHDSIGRKTLDWVRKFKVVEDTDLQELSKATLGSYVKKAAGSAASAEYRAGRAGAAADRGERTRDAEERNLKKSDKRLAGIHKAVKKIVGEAIEVSHARYVRSHGKKASGTGGWIFTKNHKGDIDHGDNSSTYQHPGSAKFSDAAKGAKAWAKKHGHAAVYVAESSEYLGETYNAGLHQFKDGSKVTIKAEEAKVLNQLLASLDKTRQAEMIEHVGKSAKNFKAVVEFANATKGN